MAVGLSRTYRQCVHVEPLARSRALRCVPRVAAKHVLLVSMVRRHDRPLRVGSYIRLGQLRIVQVRNVGVPGSVPTGSRVPRPRGAATGVADGHGGMTN
eukprot:COSAG02_NODE_7696_length_2887_cov_17.426112_3_plen_99_part_00